MSCKLIFIMVLVLYTNNNFAICEVKHYGTEHNHNNIKNKITRRKKTKIRKVISLTLSIAIFLNHLVLNLRYIC